MLSQSFEIRSRSPPQTQGCVSVPSCPRAPTFMLSSNGHVDGVLQLDAVADELVHETFTCDTRDHEDHTCADALHPLHLIMPRFAFHTS